MEHYPEYQTYVTAIATRNLLIAYVGVYVVSTLALLAGSRAISPTLFKWFTWIFGIGVYYASLVFMVVQWSAITAID